MMKSFKIVFALFVCVLLIVLGASCGQKGDYAYKKTSDGIIITDYTGTHTNLTIPSEIDGKPVVALESESFEGCSAETVIIPESVTSIGKYAFRRSANLKKIEIRAKIKTLPDAMFNFCISLEEVILPEGLEEICENAFGGAKIKSIKLPDSVKVVDDYAFYNCNYLAAFESGSGLETLGNNAFGGCISLTDVKLNEGLKSLGEYCFASCIMLENVDIPSTVEELNEGVFMATNLSEYHVSSGIKRIKGLAFGICQSLTKIYIPESVTEIHSDAFSETKGFTICGIRDSGAEIYADTYGYKFEQYDFK